MDIPPKCPMDERRMPRELYVKLTIVNITVLSAYGHLLNIRKEGGVIIHTLVAMLCPLGIIWRLLFPTIVLATRALIHYKSKSSKVAREACLRDFSLLFGRMSDAASGTPQDEYLVWPPKSPLKVVRRLMLQFILLAQCIASIYLFRRRVIRDADVLYDHRILHLAICGVCTVMLTIIDILFHPTVPSPPRASEMWIHFTRTWALRPSPADRSDNILANIVRDSIMSFTVASIVKASHLQSADNNDLFELQSINLFIIAPLGLILSVTISILGSMDRVTHSSIFHHFPFAYTGIHTFTYFFWFNYGLLEYYNILLSRSQSIQRYALLPTNIPCPAAWKDPQADYLWWLA